MTPDARLTELRRRISREVPGVGILPFSHNIITLALQEINEKFGRAAANTAVRDFKLKSKGWDEEPENEPNQNSD